MPRRPGGARRDGAGPALGRVPAGLLIPAALGVAVLVVPLVGLVVETPWSSLWSRLQDSAVVSALRLSLITATLAMTVCLLVGVPLAWVLARVQFRGRRLLRALVTVPLVLPPVVGGIALLVTYNRTGPLGGPVYDVVGFQLPFSTAAVVLAQTFVALPFLVLSVEGALRSTGGPFDEVAATLGASRWSTFRRVTLPLAGPGIASGAVLAWARALGEFGATITFAGNRPDVTRTMPLEIYTTYNTDREGALILSLLLLVASVAVLAGMRERWMGGAIR
ncbi:MAG: molybdate ABC transporter permease subunit [Nocardioidaceae bacterium]|nr:molybdate ABC transporter permease subunit [Nocardioidaceae bacterium]